MERLINWNVWSDVKTESGITYLYIAEELEISTTVEIYTQT